MPIRFDLSCQESERMSERRDCSVKALSIACGVSYVRAHDTLKTLGRRNRCGARATQWLAAVTLLGSEYKTYFQPRQPNGNKWTAKTIGKGFPKGYYIVHFRGHVAAMINGQVQDWTKDRKHRVNALYRIRKTKG